MQITEEQNQQLAKVFAVEKKPSDDRLVVQFDPATQTLFHGPKDGSKNPYRRRMRHGEAIVLRYVEEPARTPTGGKYTRRALTVRTKDGRRWFGTMNKKDQVVKLRPIPKDRLTP